MKFEPKEKKQVSQDNHSPALPGDDVAVHPFVNSFANIGAMMGRDLGVVALRAIENQRSGMGAVLFWTGKNAPDVIRNKVPESHREKMYAAMLIPVGAEVPPFTFSDVDADSLAAMKVTVIDGSQLVVFVTK